MEKLIYGIDPHALRQTGEPERPPLLSVSVLKRIGVPPRKVRRVQQELSRLAVGQPWKEPQLVALAKAIAAQLP